MVVVVSGKPKTTKSTLLNAFLPKVLLPADALEATAAGLHISGGTASDTITVHRSDGSVDVEPRHYLVERYTGRDARNSDIEWIEIQTTSEFFSDFPDLLLIDTPGKGAAGDFSKRHDEIAGTEVPKADIRIHLLAREGGSELGRLKPKPHQPLIVVQSHADTKLDMLSDSPFAGIEAERLRLEAASEGMDIEIHLCSPLLALGAELLSDEQLEPLLALGNCSDEVFEALISARACLASEIPEAPLTLSERQCIVSKMSETLFTPGGSRYGAWPVWRSGVFFSRHSEIRDVDTLREVLLKFSGIRELRRTVGSYLCSVHARQRVHRLLIEALHVLNTSALSELSSLREKIAAMESALAHAQGAVCELTSAALPALGVLKSEARTRSRRLLRYENALLYLESSAHSEGEGWEALKWLLKNDCGLPFTLRQQAIEALGLVEKKGDAN